MNKLRWLLLSLIVLGLFTYMLISPNVIGQASVGGMREITIQARAFEYTPRKFHVQEGDTVKITLIADDVTHGLILENYDVELEAYPRQDPPPTVEFVADKAGLHHFRCTVVCGPLHPFMVGEMVVEPYRKLPIAWGLTLVVAFVSVAAVQRWGHDPNKDPLGGWIFELTRFNWIRSALKSRWFQFALFVPNLFFFAVIMAAAFFGSPVGNANFAIVYVWIVWWAALKFFFIPIGGSIVGCVVADVDEAAVRSAVGDDVRAFLAGVLVAVHRQPAGTTRRPTLDSSLHRHEQLVASLETVAEARSRPVTWHALWRLPPGMVVSNQQGEEPRLRYPAVSFVASVIAVASECGTAHEPLPTV